VRRVVIRHENLNVVPALLPAEGGVDDQSLCTPCGTQSESIRVRGAEKVAKKKEADGMGMRVQFARKAAQRTDLCQYQNG
jgi:hypothetical protein